MNENNRPYGCGMCRYSRFPEGEESGGGSSDENQFECLLLGPAEVRRRNTDRDPWRVPEWVWGENPLCNDADWERVRLATGAADG